MTDITHADWYARHRERCDKLDRMVLSDGSLYSDHEIRPGPSFSWHHRKIRTGRDLRACLRAGACAWPGGYEIFMVTADYELVCHACAFERLRTLIEDIRCKGPERVTDLVCTADMDPDNSLECVHCGRLLHPEEPRKTVRDHAGRFVSKKA